MVPAFPLYLCDEVWIFYKRVKVHQLNSEKIFLRSQEQQISKSKRSIIDEMLNQVCACSVRINTSYSFSSIRHDVSMYFVVTRFECNILWLYQDNEPVICKINSRH